MGIELQLNCQYVPVIVILQYNAYATVIPFKTKRCIFLVVGIF